jgi:Zn-dependent protease with chaperone function
MAHEHSQPPDDPLRQAEARGYQRRRRRLGLASTLVDLAGLVAIVAATGAIGGVWAVVALAAVLPLAGLPFGYAGYRLSRRHGLSRQTPAGWLADRAKAAGVGLVLGGIAAAGLLGIQRLAGGWWPLPVWLAVVAFTAVLAALWPVLLLPLFLRSEPLRPGPLADALWATARSADLRVRELRLLKMGEKTAAANAMVAGLGPTVRIYVSDTLAEPAGGEDDAGALARTRVVLAHELGHHVHRDLWRLMAVSAASSLAGVLGMWAAVATLAPHGPGHLSTLPAAVLGFSLASAAVSPLTAAYSRRRERAADAYAASLTGEGETFARALERLVARNLSELEPPRLYHLLTASHPTPAERIATARSAGRVPAAAG